MHSLAFAVNTAEVAAVSILSAFADELTHSSVALDTNKSRADNNHTVLATEDTTQK